jgi:hypothetical protein
MLIRNSRAALVFCLAVTAFISAGCDPAKPAAGTRPDPDPAAKRAAEAQSVAEAALGKQAEILENGDLARTGSEQILAVNRIAGAQRASGNSGGEANSPAILIRRAAILEKNGGKWSEVLRCDEHLKNTEGYLAGTPAAQVSGWRLEYNLDAARGLEMKFTPSGSDSDAAASAAGDLPGKTVLVRWNKSAKRYQSLDQSHERFLNEVPNLETPMSILK